MPIEIERKFLVKGNFMPKVTQIYQIEQGYISEDPLRTVRIRLRDDEAYLTIKGASTREGTSRYEFEKQISLAEGKQLLLLCLPSVIRKKRHLLPLDGHLWEVDVFEGENEGLIVAEIELHAADEVFVRPEWLGEEVTGDPRYYNSQLSQHPYTTWSRK